MARQHIGTITTSQIDMWPPGFPPETVFDIAGDVILETVHDPAVCKGEPCPFHNPSDHHMKDWVMTVDSHMMGAPVISRVCRHRQTHPDPDSLHYAWKYKIRLQDHTEECDGCCRPG